MVNMTWSFKILDAEVDEEVKAASASSGFQNVAINVTPPFVDQTALIPFAEKKENTEVAVSSEDHTALIRFNYPKDRTEIVTIPANKTCERSMLTKLAVNTDSLPMHDSAHGKIF